MSDSKLIKAAEEAAAVAKGEIPAGRIWHQGHAYVPAASIEALAARVTELEAELASFRQRTTDAATLSRDMEEQQFAAVTDYWGKFRDR